MVVPTYPEGGSHALQVCQHHLTTIRLCECRQLCRVGRDSKNMLLATAPANSAETFTVPQRTDSALYGTVGVAGGGPSVHACAMFLHAESRDGDKLGQTPHCTAYRVQQRKAALWSASRRATSLREREKSTARDT